MKMLVSIFTGNFYVYWCLIGIFKNTITSLNLRNIFTEILKLGLAFVV